MSGSTRRGTPGKQARGHGLDRADRDRHRDQKREAKRRAQQSRRVARREQRWASSGGEAGS